jgi:hypothetical protein
MNVSMSEVTKWKSVEVFCCYAREDLSLLLALKNHLKPLEQEGLITLWDDININPGMEWEKEIYHHLNMAQIILLLLSSDFMNSDYCDSDTMQQAMKRYERGEALIIPIILRAVFWQQASFGKLKVLPENAMPVTSWPDRDEAFYAVTKGIREAVEKYVAKETSSRSTSPTTAIPHQSTATPASPPILKRLNHRRSLPRIVVLLLLILVLFGGGGIGIYKAISNGAQATPINTNTSKLVWESQASSTLQDLVGVAWSGSRFVVVGKSGTILTSSDGFNWTSQTSHTQKDLLAVTWSDAQFVVVGDVGTILTSPNGSTWTVRNSQTQEELEGITRYKSQLVVVGSNSTILTSHDGSTWHLQTLKPSQDLLAITWTGFQFVAVGGGSYTILTSPANGNIWTPVSENPADRLYGIAWSGSQFVVIARTGIIYTSPNGLIWAPQKSYTTEDLRGITWSKSQFVVVGFNGTILTSPDGLKWAAANSHTTKNLLGVTWSGSEFVVVGEGGTILTLH